MTVISNSSPLIALIQIGRLDVLGRLYPRVRIPPGVAKEIEPTVSELPEWLVVQRLAEPVPPQRVSATIGRGEHEVISLGLELRSDRLVLDEQPARRLAMSLGLAVIGTIGLLLAAKDRGLLAKIRPELDRLQKVRFFMNQELYD